MARTSPGNREPIFTPIAQNGPNTASSEFEDITSQYNESKNRGQIDIDIQTLNRKREIQFKASHFLLIGFFLWILYVVSSLLLDFFSHP